MAYRAGVKTQGTGGKVQSIPQEREKADGSQLLQLLPLFLQAGVTLAKLPPRSQVRSDGMRKKMAGKDYRTLQSPRKGKDFSAFKVVNCSMLLLPFPVT